MKVRRVAPVTRIERRIMGWYDELELEIWGIVCLIDYGESVVLESTCEDGCNPLEQSR